MPRRPTDFTQADIARAVREGKEAGLDDDEIEEEIARLSDVETAVYRYFNEAGRLLYVGVSLSPMQRLIQHRDTTTWFNEVVRIEIKRYPNRDVALAIEIAAIRHEKPLYNKARVPKT